MFEPDKFERKVRLIMMTVLAFGFGGAGFCLGLIHHKGEILRTIPLFAWGAASWVVMSYIDKRFITGRRAREKRTNMDGQTSQQTATTTGFHEEFGHVLQSAEETEIPGREEQTVESVSPTSARGWDILSDIKVGAIVMSKEVEDALMAVAFRGDTLVLAGSRRVRAALRNAGLIYHPVTASTHATDTATKAGAILAMYIKYSREVKHPRVSYDI